MKIKIVFIVLIFITFFSCNKDEIINPAFNVTTRTLDITNFTNLDISDNFNVLVTFDTIPEVVSIRANENLHEFIEITNFNGTLKAKIKDGVSISGAPTMDLIIDAKTLIDIKLSENANLTFFNKLITSDLNIVASGNTSMGGKLVLSNAKFNLSGNAKLNFGGNTSKLTINQIGNSEIINFDFVSDSIFSMMSGNSKSSLTAIKYLNLSATKNSNFDYMGNPLIVKSLTGNAKINKK